MKESNNRFTMACKRKKTQEIKDTQMNVGCDSNLKIRQQRILLSLQSGGIWEMIFDICTKLNFKGRSDSSVFSTVFPNCKTVGYQR